MRILIFGLILQFPASLSSQDLIFYADAMINADLPSTRTTAQDLFIPLLEQKLNKKGSYNESLDVVEWLLVEYAPDSTFRIISWQLDKGEGNFEYHGYLQRIDDSWVKFNPTDGRLAKEKDLSLPFEDWKGGMIYRIMSPDDDYFLLFTYRQLDKFTKMKTCEILVMDEVEGPRLGLPLFQAEEGAEEFVHRITLIYSADSNVSLNYDDSGQQIMFDHLIPVMGRLPGQGPTWVSDGSYRAYRQESQLWQKIDKVFDQILLRAPRPEGQKEKRDILGRKIKQR